MGSELEDNSYTMLRKALKASNTTQQLHNSYSFCSRNNIMFCISDLSVAVHAQESLNVLQWHRLDTFFGLN